MMNSNIWNIRAAVDTLVKSFDPNTKANAYVTRVDKYRRYVIRINHIDTFPVETIKAIQERIENNFCESLEYRKTLKTYMDFYLD